MSLTPLGHLPARPSMTSRSNAARTLIASGRMLKAHSRPEKVGWADEAWDMYNTVGEVRAVANATGNAASRATMHAAKRPDNPTDDPVPVHDPEDVAVQIVDAFGGTALGRAELIRRIGIQFFVSGETYVALLPTDEGEEQWHAFSSSEVRFTNDREGRVEILVEGEWKSFNPDQVFLLDIWRSHPNSWNEPDSPIRANLPVLRQIRGLTAFTDATIASRLSGAGLLLVAESVQAGDPGEELEDDVDPIMHVLLQTMETAKQDPESAAARVPIVLTVPDDMVETAAQLLSFSAPLDEQIKPLMDDAIRRFALGVDMPPEMVLGLGGLNHWGQYFAEATHVNVHLIPMLNIIADQLTVHYLWPALEEAGVEDFKDYVIWFDVTDLITEPNKAQHAEALYDRGAISAEALRHAAGFDEEDRPAETDRAFVLTLDLIKANPSLAQTPGIVQLLEDMQRVVAGHDAVLDEGNGTDAAPERAVGPDNPGALPDTQGAPAGV